MIADKNGLAWIRDLTGGLNDTDAPQDIGTNQCQIAQNVEWVRTRCGERRAGGTNTIHATEPWATGASIRAKIRHTPTADETAAELWAVAPSATDPTLGRMAGSNQFSAVTMPATDRWDNSYIKYINGVSLNGKLYFAGRTLGAGQLGPNVNRLHVWDGTNFRRVGLATPAAATVGNTGAGTYAATLRYYKVQWVYDPGSSQPRVYSELGAAVSFTPSGTGTHARVTRPSAPSEGETAWFLFGSPDGVNYYLIAGIAIATSTFDDNTAPSAYSALQPTFAGFPTDADYFTVPISAKYLLADEDRLLLLSSWETASMASAVMWTPVIGTTPPAYLVDDSERVPSSNRLDLDRGDGGGITGGGILNGTVYVFKLSHIYRLDRTGDADLPYRAVPITKALGCISHKSIAVGEDDRGAPCLYFLSLRGPYRLTVEGRIEYLGADVEALWDTFKKRPATPPFGVWHQQKRQMYWWMTIGDEITETEHGATNARVTFHARHAHYRDDAAVRGGWATTVLDDDSPDGAADGYAAVMFANTLGAAMSLDLKPYFAQRWVTGLPDGPCFKYDADGVVTDSGPNATTYIGRLKTGAFPPGGPGMKGRVTQTYVLGTPANRALAVSVLSDFGDATRIGTAALPAAAASEARVFVKVDDDARAADAMYVEIVLDDDVTPASSAAWKVDAIGLRIKTEGAI